MASKEIFLKRFLENTGPDQPNRARRPLSNLNPSLKDVGVLYRVSTSTATGGKRGHCAVTPPSMIQLLPVIDWADGPNKNTTRSAISSTVMNLLSSRRSKRRSASISPWAIRSSVYLVRTAPGEMVTTRILGAN